jgi:hypothetical protein
MSTVLLIAGLLVAANVVILAVLAFASGCDAHIEAAPSPHARMRARRRWPRRPSHGRVPSALVPSRD